MRIAVLTSGGDSAGMNAAVRAVVKQAIVRGCETYIVREGYEGLVRGNLEANDNGTANGANNDQSGVCTPPRPEDQGVEANLRFGYGGLLRDGEGDSTDPTSGKSLKGRYIVRVGWDDVRGWMGEGGTIIGTARCAAFRTIEGRTTAAHNLIKEGINALVVCGGDGSLTGADKLRAEWPQLVADLLSKGSITAEQAEMYKHLMIVGLVGSIDNDMAMTDLTIGAPTALHRICESMDNISSTASSHSRAFVIEVMGRYCGWLALMAGVSGGADFVFIPECPPTADSWEDEMCAVIKRHREMGKRKTMVIVAEGAHDKNLNPIKPDKVKDILRERLSLDTRVTTLGHTQRGGRPCAYDRVLPTLQGVEAVNALLESTPETPSYMIGIHENKISRVPLVEAVQQTQAVATAISNKDFATATRLRDPEFKEAFDGFLTVSSLDPVYILPKEKHLRIAIMHIGAPAGGMNAATRAAARYCLAHGHTPLAVQNGFTGLMDDAIYPLTWLKVDSWMTRGGSELGTNRNVPGEDIGNIASHLQKHDIDGLFMIGGFEAFEALLELEEGRKYYPQLHIPLVHLPATLSNNVPVTEFSLGSDTSLNALVDACDAIRQSASASRNRVFVVETQGGMCGYLATMGALATGAVIVYTPEVGMNLHMLRSDSKFLQRRYELDEKGKAEGRLVIKSEKASNVFSVDVITKILREEGGKLFDARYASLGHTLQGGIPSPIDRARAVRLSLKCMAFIEEHAWALRDQPAKGRKPNPKSAAVITITGSSVNLTPVKEMVEHADMKNRRGVDPWWADYKQLAEILGSKNYFAGKLGQ
ncbi:ATP-dependent 6-phosphofructokinase {ECO:0000255/HAMAP-Rule:MF_03184} Short=ATP-PFK {ECO:0000255/HAMAP-Rule:MF_03184}; Short=Phosphofructokinase {ECO:0000255/HAMAP-Rule:MF_03184}; {ECO:0000255/HAMAP-Rule:MF_03184}; AltName: Full=Phosphohexokinase {ECO:0000255/HAMAP-Rule:MF_03184} [Serendipita indica DSM 11827]|uniref:ATP-dependent 6-phosphofructokinase n=1 Tax=Serendipita indica (strain DSM 11827) TaxID=1109443 RepID=G4TIH7_SERID|nr:ATP-dependent 6-phosphofructokinase {ECO:0000255/HAMAP-Rule:MF_03184} Short=ATP-PFK {ECO:0000255/HAMAP-Rule:MF_03184}; Short=Phosphofructokinase {ECO:0000255/HAMAP-Rule:MF_03184}; {ECO:0000255/HAMAP-Rule:MF_03184}; AltName: Full=Phosphohexokinase {ECO:0000255/HAMAP-Rule:MF_03184} [Serendipita indica DSM 11827]CCA71119.1 probable 6-phosphofructokinase [Serendipita indica DSM 11827]